MRSMSGSRSASDIQLRDADLLVVDAPRDGRQDGLGLLVHLLEHEVLVAALLGGLDVPVHLVDGTLQLAPEHVGDADASGPDVGHVALLEEDDATRVGQHGRDIGGQEGLAISEADDEGHVHAGAHDPLRLALVDDGQRIGAAGAPQGHAHGLREIALVGLLDEVGDGLGVGLRLEGVAARLELDAQLDEVLDDAVVDDGQLARAVDVGMGVEVVGAAMRGPARMPQAGPGAAAYRRRAHRAGRRPCRRAS